MILVADSGSTKTEWRLINKQKDTKAYNSIGFSPYFMDSETMAEKMHEVFGADFSFGDVSDIYFYGTGCSNPEKNAIVEKALADNFKYAKINVTHDMVAAAIALCRDQKGIACILGTGSNACYYDGMNIKESAVSLGYILGDEGSGAYLGKALIKKYLYNDLPKEVALLFEKEYSITKDEVTDRIYKQPLPNRYLASFSKFYKIAKHHNYIKELLLNCLEEFFIEHVLKFKECRAVPVNFTGSISFYFSEELAVLCKKHGLELGIVLQNPIDGLVEYHAK